MEIKEDGKGKVEREKEKKQKKLEICCKHAKRLPPEKLMNHENQLI